MMTARRAGRRVVISRTRHGAAIEQEREDDERYGKDTRRCHSRQRGHFNQFYSTGWRLYSQHDPSSIDEFRSPHTLPLLFLVWHFSL
jgi:hypothetical protein